LKNLVKLKRKMKKVSFYFKFEALFFNELLFLR
jgi:hypothetical protein